MRRIVFRRLAAATVLSAAMLGAMAAAAKEESTPVTPPTPAAATPPAAAPPTPPAVPAKAGPSKVESLAFLAGAWRGDMGGSPVEEMWSKPIGTSMMGCFRWCKPDKSPNMFEMLAITEENNEAGETVVRLRLIHYTAALGPMGDSTKPMTLKLVESAESKAVFAAEKDCEDLAKVTYEVVEGQLSINVELAGQEPLKFRLKKQ